MTVVRGTVGRDHELAVFDALCDELPGQSSTLVLTGDPGVGKSFLAEECARRAEARGMQVLRTWGTPTESSLPFSGLHLLLHALRERIPLLPEPQRRALEAAFGIRSGEPPTAFLAGVATLTLLSETAATAPVVVIVDDIHWLDPVSRSALLLALRRLTVDPVMAVLTTRDESVVPVGPRVQHLSVEPLTFIEANALLDTRPDRPGGHERRRLLDLARGNPLALVELPLHTAGDTTAPGRAMLTQRLERAFRGRLDELSAAAQLAVAVAAIGDECTSGEILAVTARVLRRSATTEWLDAAASVGLLTADREGFRFRHPLVRAAVWSAITPAQRRLILRALVETIPARERSVWWRAELAAEIDDDVAAELDELAMRSIAAGDALRGLSTLRRAVSLSSAGVARIDRLLRAADTASSTGLHDLAAELLDRVIADTGDPLAKARARWQRELLPDEGSALTRGDLGPALAAIESMRSAGAPDLAIGALVHLASIAWDHSSATQPVAPLLASMRSFHLSDDDPRVLLLLAVTDPIGHGDEVIERIGLMDDSAFADPDRAWQLGYALNLAGDVDRGAVLLERAVEAFREQSRLDLLPHALLGLSWMEFLRARFGDGRADADECARIAVDLHDPVLVAASAAVRAWWDALDGVAPQTAVTPGEKSVSSAVAATWVIAAGMSELLAGDAVEASRLFRRVSDADDPAHHATFAVVCAPDAVDAALAIGDRAAARERLEFLEATTARWTAPMPTSVVRYVRIALVDADRLEESGHELTRNVIPLPFLDARAHLSIGMRLRRAKRVREARRHLHTALAAFARMPAPAWAGRAREELRASGERLADEPPSGRHTLTPQELRVAEFAASGLTNRQIAERIFLSPRTVEAHLHSAFRKLGIADRAALRSVLDGTRSG